MAGFERKTSIEKGGPLSCVIVYDFGVKKIAVNDVYSSFGTRAGNLFHEYNSENADEGMRIRAARRFMAITGFHPQRIVDEINTINTV